MAQERFNAPWMVEFVIGMLVCFLCGLGTFVFQPAFGIFLPMFCFAAGAIWSRFLSEKDGSV